jgi:hypothetical protein
MPDATGNSRTKSTLREIWSHLLIILSLIAVDLILGGALYLGKQFFDLDPYFANLIQRILSYFLVFIVLIFVLFGAAQLVLHAIKNFAFTYHYLFSKETE